MKPYNYKDQDYVQLPRWVSYFHQIDSVCKVGPKNLLEIGIGNGLVSDYLRNYGIKITTCDIEKSYNPDVVADVKDMPFKDNSFDCILACEILEHIPYQDFKESLKELSRISRDSVIISIPSAGNYFKLLTRFSGIKHIFSKELITIGFNIPFFWKKMKVNIHHYWELGWKDYPLRKIVKDLEKHFTIEETFKNIICPYHTFFILKVKKKNLEEKK